MPDRESMDQGRALLERLREHYTENKSLTVRLFWDSPLSAEDVDAVAREPRLSWLLAWKGKIFDEDDGGDSVLPKPLVLAVTWGQDKRLVRRLAEILDGQAAELRKLLSKERKSDPDFYKWVKSSEITARLLT
jgi:hypothetical protein